MTLPNEDVSQPQMKFKEVNDYRSDNGLESDASFSENRSSTVEDDDDDELMNRPNVIYDEFGNKYFKPRRLMTKSSIIFGDEEDDIDFDGVIKKDSAHTVQNNSSFTTLRESDPATFFIVKATDSVQVLLD